MNEKKYQEIIKILTEKEIGNPEKTGIEKKYKYKKGILWKKNKNKRKQVL